MEKKLTRANIQLRIAQLEQTTNVMEMDLKRRVAHKFEYLKPANILKRLLGGFATAPLQHKTLITAAVTAGVGLLTKRIFLSQLKKVKQKLASRLLQFGVKSLLFKQSGILSNMVGSFAFRMKKGGVQ